MTAHPVWEDVGAPLVDPAMRAARQVRNEDPVTAQIDEARAIGIIIWGREFCREIGPGHDPDAVSDSFASIAGRKDRDPRIILLYIDGVMQPRACVVDDMQTGLDHGALLFSCSTCVARSLMASTRRPTRLP